MLNNLSYSHSLMLSGCPQFLFFIIYSYIYERNDILFLEIHRVEGPQTQIYANYCLKV